MPKAEKSKSLEYHKPNAVQLFFKETVGELRKVNWPTRQEAWNLTLIVLAVLLGMSTALGLLDYLFTLIFEQIIL